MEIAVTLVRLLLSAVFALAGFSKLLDRSGTRKAMLGFGVPQRFATPVAVAVPIAELAVAAALVPGASAWWAAWAALGLLLAFTAAIGYQLARGRAPQCHCFGQVSSEPVGRSTLVRNVFLCAMAAVVLVAGPTRGTLASSDVTTALLVALTSIALILWRQQGQLAQRLRELEADLTGTASPAAELADLDFVLPDLDGRPVSLDDLLSHGPAVLVFSDPDCGSCAALLPEVAGWQREHADALTIAVISRGAADLNRSKLDGHPVAPVLLQHHREVADAYRVPGTPCAVLINPDRTVAGAAACGEAEIRRLVAQASTAGQPPATALGTAAPSLHLPDIDGRPTTLDDLRGAATVLLFWDPECGHCEAMLPGLREWETGTGMDGARLVLISTDDVAANRALGLSSRILLDTGFATGRAFGIGGTPMAVLLDEDARIAANVAAGAPAIWELLTRLGSSVRGGSRS